MSWLCVLIVAYFWSWQGIDFVLDLKCLGTDLLFAENLVQDRVVVPNQFFQKFSLVSGKLVIGKVLEQMNWNLELVFGKVLDEPYRLGMLAGCLWSFDEGINFFFWNFFLIQSDLVIVIDNVVHDKGVTLVNGAVNRKLQLFTFNFSLKIRTYHKNIDRGRVLVANVMDLERLLTLWELSLRSLGLVTVVGSCVAWLQRLFHAPKQFAVEYTNVIGGTGFKGLVLGF